MKLLMIIVACLFVQTALAKKISLSKPSVSLYSELQANITDTDIETFDYHLSQFDGSINWELNSKINLNFNHIYFTNNTDTTSSLTDVAINFKPASNLLLKVGSYYIPFGYFNENLRSFSADFANVQNMFEWANILESKGLAASLFYGKTFYISADMKYIYDSYNDNYSEYIFNKINSRISKGDTSSLDTSLNTLINKGEDVFRASNILPKNSSSQKTSQMDSKITAGFSYKSNKGSYNAFASYRMIFPFDLSYQKQALSIGTNNNYDLNKNINLSIKGELWSFLTEDSDTNDLFGLMMYAYPEIKIKNRLFLGLFMGVNHYDKENGREEYSNIHKALTAKYMLTSNISVGGEYLMESIYKGASNLLSEPDRAIGNLVNETAKFNVFIRGKVDF